MFEEPQIKTLEKKDADVTLLQEGIKGAHESMDYYKEMPDVRLESDEGGSYRSQNPSEVEKKRPNKYRKVAFATISNYLEMILMSLDDALDLKNELLPILDEIANAEDTTKDMIDRFDEVAYKIIDRGEKRLDEIN